MRALVFGPNGLIGAHLVERLLNEGYQVTGVSRSKKKQFSSSNYNHISLDITKKEEFSKLSGYYEVIFNLAAFIVPGYSVDEAEKSLLVNALGTLNILDFMIKNDIQRLIQSSSVTVYGNPKKLKVKESSPTNPIISYGVSKLTAEMYCNMYSNLYGLKITTLRYSPVYGKGMTQNTAITIFIGRAKRNENITIYGDGSRFQDYVYITDVVKSNILAVRNDVTGVFNIASGVNTTMKNLAETVVDVFNSSSKIIYDPSKVQEFSIGIDISKAKVELGYNPKFSLRSGLEDYKLLTL